MFSTSLSFYHHFITGVLRGGSTWWFIKDLIPSWCIHQDSFQRRSSFPHLAFRSAILSTLSFEMVLCHFWQFPCASWFTSSGMRYLNPSLSSLELSWYRFHLKPSLMNVAICGAYQWSKLSPYPSQWKRFFISSVISRKQLLFVSGRMSSHSLEMFP